MKTIKKFGILLLTVLIISCSSDDSSDNSGGNGDNNLTIGQSYQGGIIAYIDSTGQHGLIAATEDQIEIQWYNGTNIVIGTGTAIGTGLTNTNAIIAAHDGSGSYAASIARDYNGGGYTDWFLPSKDELNILYENKTAIGGFTDYSYWSSTEFDNVNAWKQYFNDGNQVFYYKQDANIVRAVRAF